MDLAAGEVAVVTGAASGIGRALATRFARNGMHVAEGIDPEPARDIPGMPPAEQTIGEVRHALGLV